MQCQTLPSLVLQNYKLNKFHTITHLLQSIRTYQLRFLGVVASSVKSRVNKAVAEQGGHNVTTTCYDYHATTLKVAAATLSTVKEIANVTVVLGSGNVQTQHEIIDVKMLCERSNTKHRDSAQYFYILDRRNVMMLLRFFAVKEAADMTTVLGSGNVQSPTVVLFDVDTGRISIVTVNTKEYHSDVMARSQG
ncbi:hypothetical protein Tco_0788293 [Tanacetum coccineum]